MIFDTFNLLSLQRNITAPADSISINDLIFEATENLDRPATPKASATLDIQPVCSRHYVQQHCFNAMHS